MALIAKASESESTAEETRMVERVNELETEIMARLGKVNKKQQKSIHKFLEIGYEIKSILTHRMKEGDHLFVGDIVVRLAPQSFMNLPRINLHLRSDGTLQTSNQPNVLTLGKNLGLSMKPSKTLGRGIMGRRKSE